MPPAPSADRISYEPMVVPIIVIAQADVDAARSLRRAARGETQI
jgi:hypothetical protein